MSNTWKLTFPAALALALSACAGGVATNQISPVANVGSAVGSNPGQPISPSEPAAITQGLTNTQAQAEQAQPSSRQRRTARRNRRPAPTNNEFGGSRTTPVSPAPSGNGG